MIPRDMTDVIATDHGITDLQITIRQDGKVVWINTNLGVCLFRICSVNGGIDVIDERRKVLPKTSAVHEESD